MEDEVKEELHENVPEQVQEIAVKEYVEYSNDEEFIPAAYRNIREKKKSPVMEVLICLLIMVGFLLIQVAVMIPYVIIYFYDEKSKMNTLGMSNEEIVNKVLNSMNVVDVSLIATAVSAIIAVIWYKLVFCKKYSFSKFKETCSRMFGGGAIAGIFFAAVALFYICNIVIGALGAVSPELLDDYQKLIESSDIANSADIFAVILTVILAPINEECIMRGIIFTRLKKCMNPVVAIVISAVFFGVFHLNIVQGIYAFLLGLFMAYLAYKYESVIPSILFHALFNGLNYILELFPEELSTNVVVACLMPVVCGFLWYFLEGRRKIAQNS